VRNRRSLAISIRKFIDRKYWWTNNTRWNLSNVRERKHTRTII